MSDDSVDKRAVGAHPESFSGRAHSRWTSWTQADPDPMCFRSCIVDTQHRRAVAHAAAELSELQIRSYVPRRYAYSVLRAASSPRQSSLTTSSRTGVTG